MNNQVIANAASMEWQGAFCDRYAILMMEYGRWFLLAALIIGTIGAAVLVVNSLRGTESGGGDDQSGGGVTAVQAIIEALKGLIEAFAKAPTWLAMFGAGALLLWMAGNAVPSYCTGVPEVTDNGSTSESEEPGRETSNDAGNSVNSTADGEEEGGGGV